MAILLIFVIPKFKDVFGDLTGEDGLPDFTQFVLDISDTVKENAFGTGTAMFAFMLTLSMCGKTKHGRFVLDKLALFFPIVGPVVEKVSIARFARTLGTLINSGVPILQALNIVKDTSGNTVVAQAVQDVHDSVKEGETIVAPLEASRVFPPMVISMVDVGEKTGDMPQMLEKIADTYDEEVDRAVESMTSLIEPVMIVFLAVIVGSIVIAMFLPLIKMIETISWQSWYLQTSQKKFLQNKIDIIEDRILSIGGSVDISESIKQQETIRDGAWDRVQGDIDYNQEQIENVREQLTVDIAQQDNRLAELDKAVNELRSKGVEVVTLEEGGVFQRAETEKIDYIAQANELRASQQAERDEIKAEKQSLRDTATADIKVFQDAIDNYRSQAQSDINGANAEINRLRNQSSTQADDNLIKIDTFNSDIDAIYANIVTLKDEKFDAESKIRNLDREVGPIKYLAQLIYGSEERDVLDQAIRLFILMLVFVFDPLAVMLVIAANQTLLRYGINLESSGPPTPPKEPDPEPTRYDHPVTPNYGHKPTVKDEQMVEATKIAEQEGMWSYFFIFLRHFDIFYYLVFYLTIIYWIYDSMFN